MTETDNYIKREERKFQQALKTVGCPKEAIPKNLLEYGESWESHLITRHVDNNLDVTWTVECEEPHDTDRPCCPANSGSHLDCIVRDNDFVVVEPKHSRFVKPEPIIGLRTPDPIANTYKIDTIIFLENNTAIIFPGIPAQTMDSYYGDMFTEEDKMLDEMFEVDDG